tara:strand:+ start:777 stop:914 length:138 start_codon:yes stop_codon:yes gene_type:complete
MLKKLYSRIWMPFFGRILFIFSQIIEGEKSKNKPTYRFTKDYDPH